MKRETTALLIGFVAVAIIVMNTNTAIGNGQYEAAIIHARTMKIDHAPRRAEVQPQTTVQAGVQNSLGTIVANFGENTKNINPNDVRILQTYLAAHGFLKEKYITGEFGPITKQAVKDFQIANNISPATGFVGDQTRALINK